MVGNGNWFDYIDFSQSLKDSDVLISVGELGGDNWQVRHLTGYAAESIERLLGEIPELTDRLHWKVGAMAAQLVRQSEELETDFNDEWLLNRMQVLLSFSETDFMSLSYLFEVGLQELTHLFSIGFDNQGIIAMPQKRGAELPPARFQCYSCLSEFSKNMAR